MAGEFVFGFTVYESFESQAVAASGIVPMPGYLSVIIFKSIRLSSIL
jgi:hypothetical protein